MPRLDVERQNEFEPKRIEGVKKTLEDLGFKVFGGHKCLYFSYNGSKVTIYPYSGWFSGKTLKQGRGFSNLIKQVRG